MRVMDRGKLRMLVGVGGILLFLPASLGLSLFLETLTYHTLRSLCWILLNLTYLAALVIIDRILTHTGG